MRGFFVIVVFVGARGALVIVGVVTTRLPFMLVARIPVLFSSCC